MAKTKHDSSKKMIEQLGAALARVAAKKSAGELAAAVAEIRAASGSIFGDLGARLPDMDVPVAARELGSRRRIGVYAALLGEEADVAARAGLEDEAQALYRRALALQLESLDAHAEGAEQTRMAIRALRAKLAALDTASEA